MNETKVRTLTAVIMALLCIALLSLLSPRVFAGSVNEPVTAEIEVECGKYTGSVNNVYVVKMENESDGAPAPLKDRLVISDSGTGRFTITITEPGTYKYLVAQEPGTNSEIFYDETVYHVTVFVTVGEDGKLVYNVSATDKKGEKPDSISFKNATEADFPSESDTSDTDGSRGESSSSSNGSLTGDKTDIYVLIVIAVLAVISAAILIISRNKRDK